MKVEEPLRLLCLKERRLRVEKPCEHGFIKILNWSFYILKEHETEKIELCET